MYKPLGVVAPVVLLGLMTILAGCDIAGDDLPEPIINKVETTHIDDPIGLLRLLDAILARQTKNFYDELGIDVQIVVSREPVGDIVQAAQTMFTERGVGRAAPTGGILILLSPADNQARIAVSRSLEGSFTDAVVGPIAKAQLAPYISYEMAGMAVMDTLSFLKNHALRSVANRSLPLAEVYRAMPTNQHAIALAASGGGGQTRVPTAAEIDALKDAPPESALPRYLPGATPLESAEAFRRVLGDNVGYPFLELYTEGAQVLRDRYPAALHEQFERYNAMRDSEPFTVEVEGDYAVVSSDTPAMGFTPVLLQRIDGLWRVDEAEVFKNLFFAHDGNYYLHNSNNPYMFGLADWGSGTYFDVAKLELAGDLHTALQKMANGANAADKFRYAELLFRNGFAALPALTHYEAAIALEPDYLDYRLVITDRFIYTGIATPAQPHIKWLKLHARERGRRQEDKSSRHIRELNNYANHRYYGKNTTVSPATAMYYWEMTNGIRRNKYASYHLCRIYSFAGNSLSSPTEALPYCNFALAEYGAARDNESNRKKIDNLHRFIERAEVALEQS